MRASKLARCTLSGAAGNGPLSGDIATSAGYDEFWIEGDFITRQRGVIHPLSFQAEDDVEPVTPARPSRQYPGQPIVGVGAVIVEDGKVVLVKRRFEPLAGQWSLPGGRLELGETLEAGLAREMLEETGLEVQVGPVVDVFDRILLDPERKVRYHYVLIDYLCRPAGGALAHGSDVAAAEFVDPTDLERYRLTPKATSVIEKAIAVARTHTWTRTSADYRRIGRNRRRTRRGVRRTRARFDPRVEDPRQAGGARSRHRKEIRRQRGLYPRRSLRPVGAPGGFTRPSPLAALDVDYLVNNAGVGVYGKFATTDLDAELKMIQLNVTSVVDLTKRFLPAMMKRRSGRILNVASTAAFVPGPWMSVYYASKAFLLSFSEAIDYELKPHAISVTTLCPGPTESEFKARAGSQRSRLFEAFVMDAPRVARAGYDVDDGRQADGGSRPAEQADPDRGARDSATAHRQVVAQSGTAVGESNMKEKAEVAESEEKVCSS